MMDVMVIFKFSEAGVRFKTDYFFNNRTIDSLFIEAKRKIKASD